MSTAAKIKGHTQCWVTQILAKSCMDARAVNLFFTGPQVIIMVQGSKNQEKILWT